MTRKTSILLPFLIFAVMSGTASAAETYATEDYVDEQFADVVGYVDGKNRTLTSRMTTNDNQLFANQELLRDMLNERDASGDWVKLNTEAQLAIPAINELNTAMGTKQDAINADNQLSVEYVSGLADVATTGSYDDLINKPTIPSAEDFVSTQKFEEVQTALEAAIADRQEKGDYLVANDLTALNNAVNALQSGKADAQTVTDLQNAINALGDKYATDEELSAAIAAVEKMIPTKVSELENDAGYLVSGDLEDYAKSADVANTYATQAYVGTIPATAEAKDIVGYVQEKTAGIATNENLTELTGRVAANETAIANKADSETVATDIAAALAEAKKYADDNDANTIYDDTALAGRVKTLEDAGYQNAEQVESAVKAATSTLATKSELDTVSTSLSEYKTSNDEAVALKANAADVYTKGEVDAAIDAIEEYDDAALVARVTANETAIGTNTAGIADNKSAIEALQGAGYVVGTKSAGSYLVNFDAQGNASYAAVEILDDKGAPIDLTTNAVK